LVSTPGTAALTEDTAKAISNVNVTIRSLHLPDPTDYLAILSELRRECSAIREKHLDAELFVATASGTPQMHACWFLLTASGELPATLLHVRPPKFVSKDLPHIEEIVPSSQSFPKVLPKRLSEGDRDDSELIDSALESLCLIVQ